MPLLRLEVDNFKSYRGKQIIGPFTEFTAVIGPNGAGKSNLMDAISFVLGIKARDLRGSQLKDLIYGAHPDGHQPPNCSVSAFFSGEDEDEDTEIQFKRLVTSKGTSEYRINEKVVSFDTYCDRLKQMGLIVKARNFLVFQGDVENIASKTPKQLTEMFEQISGSHALKDEYEEAMRARKKVDEQYSFAQKKKKDVRAERRQFKEQKEEAERYQHLVDDRDELRSQMVLWELFLLDRDMNEQEDEVARLVKEYRKAEKIKKQCEVDVKKKSKERGAIRKKQDLARKSSSKKESQINKVKPTVMKLQEQMKQNESRIETLKTDLEQRKQEHSRHKKELDEANEELGKLERASEEFERSVAEESQVEDVRLEDEQLEEYTKLKDKVNVAQTSLRQQLDRAKREKQNLLDEVDQDMTTLRELQQRKDTIESSRQQIVSRQERVKEGMERCFKDLQAKKAELDKQRSDFEKSKSKKDKIQQEITQVEHELREARADKKETTRAKRKREAFRQLKESFKESIIGTLVDLCEPKHKKYHVALTAVFGNNMHAVVVDTARTAQECIRFLRDQKLDAMTFLPLDKIKFKSTQVQLRELPGDTKLMSDVIDFPPRIEPAVLYACSNVVVCTSEQEAKRLCFTGSGTSHRRMSQDDDDDDDDAADTSGSMVKKAVTLSGTIIRASGVMEGGFASVAGRAKKWEERQVETVKQRLHDLREKQKEVSTSKMNKREDELRTLNAEVSSLQKRYTMLEHDVKTADNELQEFSKEEKTLDKELQKAQSKIDSTKSEQDKLDNQIKKLTDAYNKEVDKVFLAFCRKIGVSNIREYEETSLLEAKKRSEKRTNFAKAINQYRAHLRFLEQKDTKGPIDEMSKLIKNLQSENKTSKKELTKLEKELSDYEDDLNQLRQEEGELEDELQQIQTQVKEQKQLLTKQIKSLSDLHRKISDCETEIERLVSQRHNRLKHCKVEDILLPFITGDLETIDEILPDQETETASSGAVLSSDPDSFSTEGLKRIKERESKIELDFEQLPEELLDVHGSDAVNAMRQKYEQQLQQYSKDIESIAPNLKAIERFDDVKERFKETTTEFEEIARQRQDAVSEFETIRQKRRDLFMQAFDHVEAQIGPIYKAITKSSANPFGGTAYLTLENTDDPYMGGIKFSAIPPMKRFREMDQLSGGEKTVAALALLFAIHSFQPAPFFVLDEIDAALDNANVNRVARYITERTRNGSEFQCIVISLKDSFFSQADSLVGIFRDQDDVCSKTVTVDLTKYATEDTLLTQESSTA